MGAISSVNRGFGKVLNTSAKLCSKQLDKAVENPAKFAANMLVVSLITKDAVGCYYYTTQSLKNERIPEDKRKFVASLDLMNGILNVFSQILVFSVIKKHLTPKLFEKSIGKKLLPGNVKKYTDELLAKDGMTGANRAKVEEDVKKHLNKKSKIYKDADTGFGIIVSALATTALCKRTIVPFLSTPLAGWFKENYMDKNKSKKTQTAGADTNATSQLQNKYYALNDKDFTKNFGFIKNA